MLIQSTRQNGNTAQKTKPWWLWTRTVSCAGVWFCTWPKVSVQGLFNIDGAGKPEGPPIRSRSANQKGHRPMNNTQLTRSALWLLAGLLLVARRASDQAQQANNKPPSLPRISRRRLASHPSAWSGSTRRCSGKWTRSSLPASSPFWRATAKWWRSEPTARRTSRAARR